jgi:hypothetical protein
MADDLHLHMAPVGKFQLIDGDIEDASLVHGIDAFDLRSYVAHMNLNA